MPSHWERPGALVVVHWGSQTMGGMHFLSCGWPGWGRRWKVQNAHRDQWVEVMANFGLGVRTPPPRRNHP